ncbi:MAG: MBL fold metallo-hydrolase [Opitutales bacterium]
MHRRQFLQTTALSLGAFSLCRPGLLGQLTRPDRFEQLRRGVGYFTMRGGTIGWCIGADTFVVVDSQFPESAQVFWERASGWSGRSIDLFINTHYHRDHVGGNSVLLPKAKASIAHADVVQTLARNAAAADPGTDLPLPPADVYTGTWEQAFPDETLHLQHYGDAHTSGDSVVLFEKANVVHMGDLVFNRRAPYIDKGDDASISGWMHTLEQVHERFNEDTLFIFGHAGTDWPVTGGRADLLQMRDFLDALLAKAETTRQAGGSVEDLIEPPIVPGFEGYTDPDRPGGMTRALRAAWQEVTE